MWTKLILANQKLKGYQGRMGRIEKLRMSWEKKKSLVARMESDFWLLPATGCNATATMKNIVLENSLCNNCLIFQYNITKSHKKWKAAFLAAIILHSNTFNIAQICIWHMPDSWVFFPKWEDSEIFSRLLLDICYHGIWKDKFS